MPGAESIRENGLRDHPVVVTPDGLILDGRNRAAACELAGVEPDTVVYEGDDLAEYVIDRNSSRRHMSTGARAMSTALILAEAGRRENGRWKRGSLDVSQGSGISSGWLESLRQAGLIIDYRPELASEVVSGDLFRLFFERRFVVRCNGCYTCVDVTLDLDRLRSGADLFRLFFERRFVVR